MNTSTDVQYPSCQSKQETLLASFSPLSDQEQKYLYLIEMGRKLTLQGNKELAIEANLVKGCQSQVFLTSFLKEGNVYFSVYTEALISAGLVALLLTIYDGESPETILKCPPTCIEKLGIQASLTPGRSNGLASIHLKMKQEALRHLTSKKEVIL